MKIAEHFVTESRAASMLNVNRNTIARWGKEGKLEIQHIGRMGFVPKRQVARLKLRRKEK
jgi:predicted site-specific integrase-resolvase